MLVVLILKEANAVLLHNETFLWQTLSCHSSKFN